MKTENGRVCDEDVTMATPLLERSQAAAKDIDERTRRLGIMEAILGCVVVIGAKSRSQGRYELPVVP